MPVIDNPEWLATDILDDPPSVRETLDELEAALNATNDAAKARVQQDLDYFRAYPNPPGGLAGGTLLHPNNAANDRKARNRLSWAIAVFRIAPPGMWPLIANELENDR